MARWRGPSGEHAFVIDAEEAKSSGLEVRTPAADKAHIVDGFTTLTRNLAAIGRLEEVKP